MLTANEVDLEIKWDIGSNPIASITQPEVTIKNNVYEMQENYTTTTNETRMNIHVNKKKIEKTYLQGRISKSGDQSAYHEVLGLIDIHIFL